MKQHLKIRRDTRQATVRGDQGATSCAPKSFIILAFLMASLVTLNGCIGLSSAQTPPTSKSVSSGSSDGAVAPVVTMQPSSQTVTVGLSATFSVTASGTAPLTYQWTKNGAAIGGATASSYATPAAASTDNGALFNVTVSNSAGNATSSNATLSVTAASSYAISATPASLSFTAQTGAASPASQSVVIDDTTSGPLPFTLAADQPWITLSTPAATTRATVQFGVNSSSLAAGTYTGHIFVSASGVNNSPLSVPITLTVTAASVAPSLTTQPASQTVPVGQTATFSVAASGTAPLTYQWSKNGAAIGGATASSYTTPAAASTDNGALFNVTVSNSAGTATSNNATLTVAAASTYTISATPASLSFTAQTGAASPASQSVVIDDTTPGPLPFTLAADQSWITLSTSAATTKATVQFGVNSSSLAAGTYTGHIIVSASGVNNSPLSVPVTLTVAAPGKATLSANPSSLSFGSVSMGSTSTLPVTLTNSGSANLTINNVSLSGPGFNVSGISSGQTLTPGQTATLSVTLTPSATGSAAGSVTLTSNASDSTLSITLSGTGAQAVAHSATLSWGASTSSSVTGYNVYRATSSGGESGTTAINGSALISGSSYTDSSVTAGATYYYVVTSVNSSGVQSAFSNEISGTIP